MKGISPNTNIGLFADGTKIWRSMEKEDHCVIVQKDIDYLNQRCKDNQMKFHPEKCKVVSVISKINRLSYITLLPMSRFYYTAEGIILNYVS